MYGQKIEAVFDFSGRAPPVSAGHLLLSAVARLVPEVHQGLGWALAARDGRLLVRLPQRSVSALVALQGARLRVGRFGDLWLGDMRAQRVRSHRQLAASMVTARGHIEREDFTAYLRERLAEVGVVGRLEVGRRGVVEIKGYKVVGYACRVSGLDEVGSIWLQENGLGGRRSMGCGVFVEAA